VHDLVCREAFSEQRNSFTQFFGTEDVDASLLLLPLVGFLPANDPRIVGTVAAIERDLLHNGFVRRYCPRQDVDGLPEGEGVFIACTFWLADNYHLQGRHDEAVQVFERLVGLCNDLGMLAEEVRCRRSPAARQLSTGVLARDVDQHGAQSLPHSGAC
jgi:glucoamylase